MVQTLTRPSGPGVSTLGAPRSPGSSVAFDPLSHTVAFVLAGGEGRRLRPLTIDRSKPSLRFGGQHRLVDFAISNLVNAGFRRIVVLSRDTEDLLHEHLADRWPDPYPVHEYRIIGRLIGNLPAEGCGRQLEVRRRHDQIPQ